MYRARHYERMRLGTFTKQNHVVDSGLIGGPSRFIVSPSPPLPRQVLAETLVLVIGARIRRSHIAIKGRAGWRAGPFIGDAKKGSEKRRDVLVGITVVARPRAKENGVLSRPV